MPRVRLQTAPRWRLIPLVGILMIGAVGSAAAGTLADGLRRADALRDSKKCEQALPVYSSVVAVDPSAPEAVEAELGAAQCLDEMGRTDEAIARLSLVSRRHEGRPENAKVLLALARLHHLRGFKARGTRQAELASAVSLYDAIFAGYPRSIEAIEAQLGKAGCLAKLGRENEAVELREKVAREHPGTEYAARALLGLGDFYESREQRGRAAAFYRTVLEECPGDSTWTRMARSRLEMLDKYWFGPLYDKLKWWIGHYVVDGLLHLDREAPFGFALGVGLEMGLTRYLVCLVALGLTALLLAGAARLLPPTPGAAPGILNRTWSLRRIAAVLAGVWTCDLVLEVIALTIGPASIGHNKRAVEFIFTCITLGGLLPSAMMIAAVMWKESPRRLFFLPWAVVRRAILALGVAALGLFFAAVIVVLVQRVLENLGAVGTVKQWLPARLSSNASWTWATISYFVGAVAEEFIYRGAVFQALRSRTGTWAAAALSSMLFALVHAEPLRQTLWLFGLGLVLTWLVSRTRSLTPPTLFHWLFNLLVHAAAR